MPMHIEVGLKTSGPQTPWGSVQILGPNQTHGARISAAGDAFLNEAPGRFSNTVRPNR